MKRIMSPNMEKVVKALLYELGINNINDVDTYHDLIKLSRIINSEEDLEKLVYSIFTQLKNSLHSDYIKMLIYLDRLEYPLAGRIFGICYYEGIFYEQSYSNALIAFSSAAKLGDEYSIKMVAKMYLEGKIIPQDIEKATDLYMEIAEKMSIEEQVALGKICESIKNYTKAIYWYTKAANQGDANALYELSGIYFDGKGVAKDIHKGIELLTKAANQGHANSLFELGLIYNSGIDVPRDLEKVKKLLTKALEAGHDKAQTFLGIVYFNNEDYDKAIYHLTEASNQGDVDALFQLSMMYAEGKGVSKDAQKAFDLLTKAAKMGHIESQTILGGVYLNEKEYIQAIYWFTEGSNQGNPEALFQLSMMYAEGKGVPKDGEKTINLLTQAAKAGHIKAQTFLGIVYFNNEDYDKAIYHLTEASNEGDVDALFRLALMYNDGKGVSKDAQKAFDLLTKAAKMGHIESQTILGGVYLNEKEYIQAIYWFTEGSNQGNPEALFQLSMMYAEGKGVPKDGEKTINLLTQAAKAGHIKAQKFLGEIYENIKEYNEAICWYTKAAEKGDCDSLYNLALIYYNGRGIGKNPAKAIELYTKAAELGHMSSQYNLAVIYHLGEIVPQDFDKAIYWYTKAAEKGDATAQYNLGSVYELVGDSNKAEYWKNLGIKNGYWF